MEELSVPAVRSHAESATGCDLKDAIGRRRAAGRRRATELGLVNSRTGQTAAANQDISGGGTAMLCHARVIAGCALP